MKDFRATYNIIEIYNNLKILNKEKITNISTHSFILTPQTSNISSLIKT